MARVVPPSGTATAYLRASDTLNTATGVATSWPTRPIHNTTTATAPRLEMANIAQNAEKIGLPDSRLPD
jgi:hypothetical protein